MLVPFHSLQLSFPVLGSSIKDRPFSLSLLRFELPLSLGIPVMIEKKMTAEVGTNLNRGKTGVMAEIQSLMPVASARKRSIIKDPR